jgi:hypothetical protein
MSFDPTTSRTLLFRSERMGTFRFQPITMRMEKLTSRCSDRRRQHGSSRSRAEHRHRIVPFGSTGDQPVVSDYDGDRKADIGIIRPAAAEPNGGSLEAQPDYSRCSSVHRLTKQFKATTPAMAKPTSRSGDLRQVNGSLFEARIFRTMHFRSVQMAT